MSTRDQLPRDEKDEGGSLTGHSARCRLSELSHLDAEAAWYNPVGQVGPTSDLIGRGTVRHTLSFIGDDSPR